MRTFSKRNRGSVDERLGLRTSHRGALCDDPNFILLHHRIRSREARWETLMKNSGESLFLNCYWEWLEDVLGRAERILKEAHLYDAVYASLFHYDREMPNFKSFCEFWCPATNTLHTACGEMSISLWDLYKLGGLPIVGSMYDEAVPTLGELTGANKGGHSLPRSCQYLFLAYHKIFQSKKRVPVKLSSWVEFWYKGKHRYADIAIKSVRNKTQAPKETYNPSGKIYPAKTRSEKERAIFDDLGIPSGDREETYLAAFLSCWLCKFVFPGEGGVVRPSVFKTASLMARGSKFSLGVPVLANLYHGLNQLSSSKDPGKCDVVMPYHYLYGWLGLYFGTHFTHKDSPEHPVMIQYSGKKFANSIDLRPSILSSTGVSMNKLVRKLYKEETWTNDDSLPYDDLTYFVSLRSHFLATRLDGRCMVQPYSPDRFSRQFGYQQCKPRHLTEGDCMRPLEELHNYWVPFENVLCGSKVTLPDRKELQDYQVSGDYLEWWLNVFKPDEDLSMRASRSKDDAVPRTKAKDSPVERPRSSQEKVVRLATHEIPVSLKRKKAAMHDEGPSTFHGDSDSEERRHRQRRDDLAFELFGDTSIPQDVVIENPSVPQNEVTADVLESDATDSDADGSKGLLIAKTNELSSLGTSVSSSGTSASSSGTSASSSASEAAYKVSLSNAPSSDPRLASLIEDKVKDIVSGSLPQLLPSIVNCLGGFYEMISQYGVDPTPLKAKVGAYIAEVSKLSSTRLAYLDKKSQAASTEILGENAINSKEEMAKVTEWKSKCKKTRDQIAELNKQFKGKKDQLSKHEGRLAQLREERVLLKNTALTPDEDNFLATYAKKIEDLNNNFRTPT